MKKGWSKERLERHEEHVAEIAAEWAVLEQLRVALTGLETAASRKVRAPRVEPAYFACFLSRRASPT